MASTVAPVQALPLLAARLRKLAMSVRSIGSGYGCRENRERILLAKHEIAFEMERLATLVEGRR
jgi:hypothetical protein